MGRLFWSAAALFVLLSLDLRHSRPTFPNATAPEVDAAAAGAEEGEE